MSAFCPSVGRSATCLVNVADDFVWETEFYSARVALTTSDIDVLCPFAVRYFSALASSSGL